MAEECMFYLKKHKPLRDFALKHAISQILWLPESYAQYKLTLCVFWNCYSMSSCHKFNLE